MFTFSIVAVLVLLLLITIKFLPRENLTTGYKLPPGPKQKLLFGNLVDLLYSTFFKGEAPFLKFAKWSLQFGPICYLRFFRQRVVVISDSRVAQQLCVGQADKFSSRPPGLFLARVLKGKGIVFNDGPSWKEHRNFINQEFRKFGFGHQSIEHRIQFVVDEYLQQVAKTNGKSHNPHENISTAIYNIIWTVISGDQFKWDDPFLRKLINNLETNLQAVELTGAHNYVTIFTLCHLIWHNPFRLTKIVFTRFTYFRKLIRKYKNRRTTQSTAAEDDDSMICDYLVKMKNAKSNKESTYFSESQLLWLVSDLFIAGGETTITTLRWLLLCMATYPDVQERIRREISETIGQDSSPMYSQRTQLPYMEAFIHEVLRFCGVTPVMWRNTTHDAIYEDYIIPKDTWVLLHFWAMSHNTTWKDEQEFRPERFLNEEGQFCKNNNLLAFSTGKRQCPGEALARTELFLFTTGILQKYRVVLPPDQKVDIRGGHFKVTYTPPDHLLQFVPL